MVLQFPYFYFSFYKNTSSYFILSLLITIFLGKCLILKIFIYSLFLVMNTGLNGLKSSRLFCLIIFQLPKPVFFPFKQCQEYTNNSEICSCKITDNIVWKLRFTLFIFSEIIKESSIAQIVNIDVQVSLPFILIAHTLKPLKI